MSFPTYCGQITGTVEGSPVEQQKTNKWTYKVGESVRLIGKVGSYKVAERGISVNVKTLKPENIYRLNQGEHCSNGDTWYSESAICPNVPPKELRLASPSRCNEEMFRDAPPMSIFNQVHCPVSFGGIVGIRHGLGPLRRSVVVLAVSDWWFLCASLQGNEIGPIKWESLADSGIVPYRGNGKWNQYNYTELVCRSDSPDIFKYIPAHLMSPDLREIASPTWPFSPSSVEHEAH